MHWYMLLTLTALVPSALAATVQKPGLAVPDSYAGSKDAVKDLFVTSYDAYKEYAWGHDDLTPQSLSFYDGRNGWGASIVDAMSTMYAMGLTDLLDEAVEYVGTIDFSESKTEDTVSVFETTIRYVGGLLSVYELRGQTDQVLLTKAQEVADKLVYAWVDDNDLPFGHLNFDTNEPELDTSNIAEAGTLLLEWATLSKYTGNDTYRELADKAMRHIMGLASPLPGLAPQSIDPATGEFVGGYVTWSGGADSYFEYLVKYPRLFNVEDPAYMDTWLTAVDSSIKSLLRRSTVGDHLYTCSYDATAEDDAKKFRLISSHLACFHGGNWLFGAALTNNETIADYALGLIEGCWNTYASTATGIGPEAFAYLSEESNYTGLDDPTEDQLAFYQKHGFYSTSSYYVLRPEVLESVFYGWRITGDTKYLDYAASAVESFKEYLPANVAFDGLVNVDDPNSERVDDMESFWFAEVLKYLYLIFDDPTNMSLDEYVFNTEAHPLKAPVALDSYGTKRLVDNGRFFGTGTADHPQVSMVPGLDMGDAIGAS